MAVSIRLPEDLELRLESLAARTGRSKAFYIREALHTHLEDLEDLYLAERELKAVHEGRSKTRPLEQVMKRHRVEG